MLRYVLCIAAGKGEGPRKNWEKVQVLWICRGVGVVPSRVIQDEYRIEGAQNDRQMIIDISCQSYTPQLALQRVEKVS